GPPVPRAATAAPAPRPAPAAAGTAAYPSGPAPPTARPPPPQVFEVCDEDNKDDLSREDFKVAVVMLFGYKPSKLGLLFEKLLNLMSAKKAAQLHSNKTRQIFTASDVQGRGFLTFEDFKRAFNPVSPKVAEKITVEVSEKSIRILMATSASKSLNLR
ncbi:EF-hand calcium-binding domain-containing protein 11, partial [Tyto alba]|uniref:EF-hand calcium-binding domain-containing protein 11 n=1 Tax=Tyto alba TaxID=56313 RepID=UPI001C67002B